MQRLPLATRSSIDSWLTFVFDSIGCVFCTTLWERVFRRRRFKDEMLVLVREGSKVGMVWEASSAPPLLSAPIHLLNGLQFVECLEGLGWRQRRRRWSVSFFTSRKVARKTWNFHSKTLKIKSRKNPYHAWSHSPPWAMTCRLKGVPPTLCSSTSWSEHGIQSLVRFLSTLRNQF